MDDPAAVATLAVVRSVGGVGAVTLRWQLEDQAADDLSPFNGTLVFAEVQDKMENVTKYQATRIILLCQPTYYITNFFTKSAKSFDFIPDSDHEDICDQSPR